MRRLTSLIAVCLALGCARKARTTAIASELSQVAGVQIDADNVYWRGPNTIQRATKEGKESTTMVRAEVSHFAVDSSGVYFTSAAAGTVGMMPLRGGGAGMTLANKQEKPGRLATDLVFVYVCTGADSGSVVKIPKAGGRVVTLADKQSDPQAVVVDGSHVFFGTSNGQLMRVSKAGGPVDKLDAETAVITDVALDETDVYWVQSFAPAVTVSRIPKKGGEKKLVAKLEGDAPVLAVNAGHVYVSVNHEKKVRVYRVPATGGELREIARADGELAGLAVDRTTVFFGARDPKGEEGAILTFAK
jgi:hypothetical protein